MQANPRLTAAFCCVSLCSSIRRIPSSRPSDDPRWPPAVSSDPSPPEPHRRPSQSPAATERGSAATATRTIRTIVLEQGFEGARLNTRAVSDFQTLAATVLANFTIRRIPTLEQGYRAFFDRIEGVDQTDGGHTSSAATPRPAACCTTSGWERTVLGVPWHFLKRRTLSSCSSKLYANCADGLLVKTRSCDGIRR